MSVWNKVEAQKIINLLNDSSNEESKFATKRWYVIDSQTTKGKYKQCDTIKFETESIKSSFSDYSDIYILIAGNIPVAANNGTDVEFKTCAPFSTCMTEINNVFVDEVNHIYIDMPLYKLIEHSDNYSEISGSVWQFKRDDVPANNAEMIINNSPSFKYKAALLGKTEHHNNGESFVKDSEIVVPLKYLSKFWRSLEMPLINCKVHLKLNWIEDCILSSNENFAKVKIADAKLHVPIVTLCTKDKLNLKKRLSEGFKRSVYWNSYQAKPAKVIEKGKNIYELLNSSFQGVRRLFVLASFIAAGAANGETDIRSNKKNFFPRGEIKNHYVSINRRAFYDQLINDLIKHYDEVRKVLTGQGDDYTTGCYAYFKDNYD